MSKKKKSGNLGSALEAAGITADKYAIPYDPKKIATDLAGYLADGLRGKVLFNHTPEFTEADYDELRVSGWDNVYQAFQVSHKDFDQDLDYARHGLLASLKEHIGNRFVAFAQVPPTRDPGHVARVRHVSARCQFERRPEGLLCIIDVYACTSGARDV